MALAVGGAVAALALAFGLVRSEQARFTRSLEVELETAADEATATIDGALRRRSLELQRRLLGSIDATDPTGNIVTEVEALRSAREFNRLVLMDAEGQLVVPGDTSSRRPNRERAPFEGPLRRLDLFGEPGTAIRNLPPTRGRGAPELIGLGSTRLLLGHYRLPAELFGELDSLAEKPAAQRQLAYRAVDTMGDELHATAQHDTSWQPATQTLDTFPGWRLEASLLGSSVEALATARARRALWLAIAAITVLTCGVIVWARWRAAADPPSITPLSGVTDGQSTATIGDCSVHLERFELERGGRTERLSVREVELLRFLLANRGVVVRRDTLLDSVWGYGADIETRTLDTFVYRLRQKLEPDPSRAQHLVTVRGVGYKLTTK